jgi:hypothetical protein
MGFVGSIMLIVVGAILKFAVSVTTTGFNIQTIGLILILAGILGLLVSAVFWSSWGGFGHSGNFKRQHSVTADGVGGYVEEEQRSSAL